MRVFLAISSEKSPYTTLLLTLHATASPQLAAGKGATSQLGFLFLVEYTTMGLLKFLKVL